MTVDELIKHLGDLPRDLPVMVDGYEDGLEDLEPQQIREVTVRLNYHDTKEHWYYGPHEWTQEGDTRAILLSRVS